MRLLLEIGYQKVLFGKGAPIAEILASLDGLKSVVQEGYGESKLYKVKDDISIEAFLVNDDSISLPDSSKTKEYEAFHEVAKERDSWMNKYKEVEKQLREIQTLARKEG